MGGPGAFRRPSWQAWWLLSRGTIEAVMRMQPREPQESWRHRPREALATFLHAPGVGTDHPSRIFAVQLVRARETILDIGCGAGVNYEVLAAAGLAAGYVGVDSSEPSVDIARELYPQGDFRVGNAHELVRQFGARSFDVVHMRHVLEHLPDFEEAMTQALAVARRLAIFIFFLTPRHLPFGVRKINLGLNPTIYTYVYSQEAIEAFLAHQGLEWRWTLGVGTSRAGWFAGEMNSVLEVRYP
jgi:SAM-dependent methyltransferase